MDPKISIITPSFNSAKFIEDAIQSVVRQNYSNVEHIVVDGGSSDGTVGVLKRYGHLKWISEKDDGQSDALNKGLAMSTGDIVGWLNADDVYLEGTFAKVVRSLADPSTDGVYSDFYFTDENLQPTRKIKSHNPVRWLSLFHCYIPSVTFFFKRKIIDRGITFDKNMHLLMDKDFFARILYAGFRLRYVNDSFSKFRWHKENKSLQSVEDASVRLREGLTIFNRYSSHAVPVTPFTQWCYRILDDGVLKVLRRVLVLRETFSRLWSSQ